MKSAGIVLMVLTKSKGLVLTLLILCNINQVSLAQVTDTTNIASKATDLPVKSMEPDYIPYVLLAAAAFSILMVVKGLLAGDQESDNNGSADISNQAKSTIKPLAATYTTPVGSKPITTSKIIVPALIAEQTPKQIDELATAEVKSTEAISDELPSVDEDNGRLSPPPLMQPPPAPPEVIVAEVEQRSSVKYIGYNPINIFRQDYPNTYPVVSMPKPGSVIKFPRKGRTGRKGYKEDSFINELQKVFGDDFKIYQDRHITLHSSSVRYEPDITMIDEREGRNLFVNIEIDEPYEGTSDIKNRRVTHTKGSDRSRDAAFTARGWIVIRFAEIQVHEKPTECLLFIADVLKSIIPVYTISELYSTTDELEPVRCWNSERARSWSLNMYREAYLGISGFGYVGNSAVLSSPQETDVEAAIEEEVVDVPLEAIPTSRDRTIREEIESAISKGMYLRLKTNEGVTFCKPIVMQSAATLKIHSLISNIDMIVDIASIEELSAVKSPYLYRYEKNKDELTEAIRLLRIAIQNGKVARMNYTKSDFMFDQEDTTSNTNTRTISDVMQATDAQDAEHVQRYNLNEKHISCYCHLRSEQRTFNIHRINWLEILNFEA